jgi:hypothetical protein
MTLSDQELKALETYFSGQDGELIKDRKFNPGRIAEKAAQVLHGSEELSRKLVRSSGDFAGKLPTATYRQLMGKDPRSPAVVMAENQAAAIGLRPGSQAGFKEPGRVTNPASSANFSNLPKDRTTTADIASDSVCDAVGVPRGSTWQAVRDASNK